MGELYPIVWINYDVCRQNAETKSNTQINYTNQDRKTVG